MNKTILQVPIDKKIRDQALLAANDLGFSSLQEPVRIFIKKLSTGKAGFNFDFEEPVKLSAKAIKRYNQITKDIESGKTKLFRAKNVEELMEHISQA